MKNKYTALLCLSLLQLVARAQNVPQLAETAPAGTLTFTLATPSALSSGSSAGYHYVRTFVPRIAIADATTITAASEPADVSITTEYLDGFQRPMQSVVHNFTPGKSLVQPVDTRFQQYTAGYLPYTRTGTGFRTNAFSEQESYYASNYADDGNTAYGFTKDTSTATERYSTTYTPGKSQVGQRRGSVVKKLTNDASQVRLWTVNASGAPVSTAYYAANQLFGEELTTPEGGRQLIFTNKDGRVVYKKELVETNAVAGGGLVNTEGITYYVYDALGRQAFVLTPRAMDIVGTVGTVTITILKNQCFQYKYDAKGRLIGKMFPGEEDFTEMVYDRKDRLVLRRSPLEAAMGKWEVTFYDKTNRVLATALYTSTTSQATWQAQIDAVSPTLSDATNILYYLGTDAGETYPGAISGNEVLSYTYYDHYNYSTTAVPVLGDAYSEASFTESPVGAIAPVRSLRTQGMVTASRVKVVKPSGTAAELGDWIETVNYYDDKGRVIQQRTRNATQSGTTAGKEMVCNYYAYNGKLLLSDHYHENKKTSHIANEYTSYQYEPTTGRLVQTAHKVNNDVWKILSLYTYDELGRVSREVLGNHGEARDYTYNIRGQLMGINGDYAETGNKGGVRRSFGESLKYDFGYTGVRYDGKITGMIWRGSGDNSMSYGYRYDKSGRLKAADFRKWEVNYTHPFGAWSNVWTDYSVANMKYDVGGNITRMKQMGMGAVDGSIIPVVMDTLSYYYETRSNRLARVEDTVASNYNIGDFINGNVTTADYAYDASGNITKDLNKGISNITYTFFNKPQVITFSNGNTIQYTYDAGGNKLQELVTIAGTPKRKDYIGNFVYQDDYLEYISTGKGRTVYTPIDGKYNEQFFVKDHLGNVRSTVDVYTYPVSEYLATYEVASAGLEGLMFDKVSEIAEDNPAPNPGNMQSGMLNGSIASKRVGTSLLLRVMAGDRVEMNVNSYYEGYNPGTDAPVTASTMLSSIVSTLTTGSGGLGGSESHNPQLVGQMFNSNNYTQFANMVNNSTDPGKPKAYLNYILFSESMQIVGTFSGAYQANGNFTWGELGTTEPMEIPTNGFLGVYITNGSNSNVFFDQLTIRLTKGNLLEETHYYPHGLPMGNIGSSASGFLTNREKHQGNEYIKDAGLNWMDFNFRQYDPQIGRFLSVDPLASSVGQEVYSPYAAMYNAPESIIDPNGLYGIGDRMELAGSRYAIVEPLPFLSNSVKRMAMGDLQAIIGDLLAKSKGFDQGGSGVIWDMVSEGYSDGYKQSYIGALSAVHTKAAGNFGGAGGSESAGDATESSSSAEDSNNPGASAILKRGGLIGWLLDGVQKVFGSAHVPNWAATPFITSGTFAVDDVKDIAKQGHIKQRKDQTGSYTIMFSDGHKYHGKGSAKRMMISAIEKMTTYRVNVTSLEWRPATSNRQAFKDEYYRMQTDRIPDQYEEGYRNPINYNLIQSPGKKYVDQDGY